MSKLYVNEIAPKTAGQTITLPAGMIVGAEVKHIQGVTNLDSDNNSYCYIKWLINGSHFVSTGSSTPYTHAFYSYTSLNNVGYMPSTIITSVNNTDGSNVTVVCQGATNSGTLHINRSGGAGYSGSPSSVMFLEIAK